MTWSAEKSWILSLETERGNLGGGWFTAYSALVHEKLETTV